MATGFQALMMMAKANTEASQAALAEEVRQREARERKRREEDDRKEMERKRREKERLTKAREQEAIREAKIQQERQERIRRRQEEAAAAKAAAPATPSSSKPRASSQSGSRSSKPLKVAAPSQMNSEEQRAFDREQKAARARARLFDEDPPKRSAAAAGIKRHGSTNGLMGTARLSSKGKARTARSSSNPSGPTSASRPKDLSARARIAAEFKNGAAQFTALNQVKRDRRTIEEVERDMRIRKGEAVAGVDDIFGDPRMKKLSRDPSKTEAKSAAARSSQMPARSQPPAAAVGSTPGKPTAPEPVRVPAAPLKAPDAKRKPGAAAHESPAKRPRIAAGQTGQPRKAAVKGGPGAGPRPSRMDEGSEEEDDSDADFVEDDVGADMRDQIWQIMGKDRRQYASRAAYSDEESDDMEAGAGDVLEEEGRAARLAREEDLREQEALKKHEAEKRRRLAAANR